MPFQPLTSKKAHFATLMDICHLKNGELQPKYQKCKGRVVLRGDIVIDDSGSHAVFTEQGSSAPQMTAAKDMDIIARLPGCGGQAADAVSADIPSKDGRRSKIAQNSEVRTSRFVDYVFHDTNGPNPGRTLKIQCFLSNEICTDTDLQASCGKDSLVKFHWDLDGKKVTNWECHRKQGLFLSVYVNDIKMAGRTG